jgi:phosphate:Na+ symporter
MKAYNYEDEINNFRAQLRNDLLERTDTNKDLYLQTTYYMDLVNECEKVGDYVINVLTTMS